MLKIGLTGGIGSGKTTVAKLFEMLGVPVFYADLEAHYIRCRVEVSEQIIRHFGSAILSNQRIDKKKLATLIFNDSEALQWINNLIHPLVEKAFEDWCSRQFKQHIPFVMMESAWIFEAGFERLFDRTIAVSAPEELRISRVIHREDITNDEVLRRIQSQMNAEEKYKKTDVVIWNDERRSLIEQVSIVLQSFLVQ